MSSSKLLEKLLAEKKIFQIAKICRTSISSLFRAVKAGNASVEFQVSERNVQQLQERYDQWAGNLGVLKSPKSPSSLEHRLRDSPAVSDAILGILVDLNESAQAATDILTGKRNNRTARPLSDSDIDLTEYDISSSDSDTNTDSDTGSESSTPVSALPTNNRTEIQELMSAIKNGLDNLFRASIFIRKFAPKDKHQRASRVSAFDNRADIMYIKDRYPLVIKKNEALLMKLGEANARRRRYFTYRQSHNERLSRPDVEEGELNLSLNPEPSTNKPSELVAHEAEKSVLSGHTKPSRLAETEATKFINPHDHNQLSTFLNPEPAMSVVSFATSIVESSDASLSFPPMPAEAENNRAILCPYCYTVIDLKARNREKQWKKHILEDLEPYICTFPTCGLDTYTSQHVWFEHELLMHRFNWHCPICQNVFDSYDAFKQHITQQHTEEITSHQITATIEQSKRPINSISPDQCPFCDEKWASIETSEELGDQSLVVKLDQFQRHLAYHLQQVALFSLPRLSQDEDADSQGVGGVLDRDPMPSGYKWVRDDCGRGWSIISNKRATFIAFSFFLGRSQLHEPISTEPQPDAKRFYEQEHLSEEAASAPSAVLGGSPPEVAEDPNKAIGRRGELHKAALKNQPDRIRELLNSGANKDQRDEYLCTPLHLALYCGSDKAAALLIQAGADVNARNLRGITPLLVAADRSSKETVQMLLEMGAKTNVLTEEGSRTPLQAAIAEGKLDTVRVFVEKDIEASDKSIFFKNKFGDTPLHEVARYRDSSSSISVDILHELLRIAPDIDISVQNSNGETPLDIAYQQGNGKLIQALLAVETKDRESEVECEDSKLENTDLGKERKVSDKEQSAGPGDTAIGLSS
ncbi:Serine/threonine-protein kinase TNNI3K [Cladobotryum mycophilum]|uniref:Serine/threonine-protein kinase TNNI3K n=1 Tax=Cladobotryum mycophilum TaxID=491253 RepID=A0ABR0T3Y0_9HYPO